MLNCHQRKELFCLIHGYWLLAIDYWLLYWINQSLTSIIEMLIFTNNLLIYFQAKLESKLFSLHRQLLGLHQSLTVTWSHDHQPMQLTNQHQSLAAKQRLSGLLAQCQKSISESCSDLLSLSILVPAAPWVRISSLSFQRQSLPLDFGSV